MREKFFRRDREGSTEPPAPSHLIARGRPGPSLLAMILASKFLLHQPLNRQSETYAHEGVEIDPSMLVGCVGTSVATLDPIFEAIRRLVFGAG
jgi:transposase